tara:strand:- start:34 stop:483 length:450 start_codon:yes stop_codon:yes gene_type:complete
MKLFIFFLLILFDYFTKKLIFNLIDLNAFVTILPFMDITHLHNYGITFGLFSGIPPPWLIAFISAILIIIVFWMFQISNPLEKWGFLFIITGAVSNLGDRIINDYVLDFIYMHYNNFYWPAFNFADIYITIGVLIIIYVNFMIFRKKND